MARGSRRQTLFEDEDEHTFFPTLGLKSANAQAEVEEREDRHAMEFNLNELGCLEVYVSQPTKVKPRHGALSGPLTVFSLSG
jgi:hypothetical protein